MTVTEQPTSPHPSTSSNFNIDKCPIDHTKASKATWLQLGQTLDAPHPEPEKPNNSEQNTKPTGCPVDHAKGDVDPRNLMPRDAKFYKPTENQNVALDQNREISTIPKAEGDAAESHWVYPSEQMFYNAMKRKNWNPSEDDMKVLVPIHNAVNERAWNMILRYEEMYKSTCGNPKLVQFQGKPKDYTPKARFKNLFGYTLPFDRHDWSVDRCGTEVRYIIDFYSGQPSRYQPDLPSFYLDVRPDLSLQGLMDRVRYFFRNFTS